MRKIKRIIRFIDRLVLLGATLTSLLYFIYIIVISMYNYLYNRPIRTAVLCGAFGVIMLALDTIEDNKKKQAQTRANRCKQAQTTKQVNRQAQTRI